MDKRDLAIQLVQQNGYLADSEDGRKRVQAILVAAEVCETYAQFTRAAQYALEVGFTKQSFTHKLARGFQYFRGAAVLAAAVPAIGVLVDLADDGLLNFSHITGILAGVGLS